MITQDIYPGLGIRTNGADVMVKTKLIDWDPLYKESFVKDFKKSVSVKAFIQARVGSTRLPNKIYEDINGAPMLWHTVSRAKQCQLIDDVIVISPQILPELPDNIKGFAWNGPENDVLGRYAAALKEHHCDYVVRLTSDCPLLDPFLIDYVISQGIGHDYCSNVMVSTFPDGMDAEIMSNDVLNGLDQYVKSEKDREHVTTHIRNDPFVQSGLDIVSIQSVKDYSYIKLSVDTEDDLEYVKKVDKELCRI